ncbi:MAG: N-acetylmuramoyl-L-alanine amidase [Saprospiraceae bacterium]
MKKALRIYLLLTVLLSFYAFAPLNNLKEIATSFNKKPLSIKESKDNQISVNGYRIKTIVLDAGHGGKDAGCSGKTSKEKHVALNVVLKLGQAIERQFPSINVIYTRKTDVFIPLYKRAAIANKNNADLFISIHCNALGHKAHLVHGSETYVMGLHTAEHNLDVARRENESILLEDNYQKNYQGFDPNSDEGYIFLSMFQNAFLDKSIQFAEKVETKIKVKAHRKSRGVKQAGFVVLKETTMPSVLIETGYLTNATEEAFLVTNTGQNKMANAIFEAFIDYKLEVEEQTSVPLMELRPQSVAMVEPTKQHIPLRQARPVVEKVIAQPTISTQQKIAAPKAIPTSLIVKENPALNKLANNMAPPKTVALPTTKKPKIIFKIQLAASPAELETSNQKWSKIQFVEVRKEKNLYKYLTGSHTDYEIALRSRNEVLGKGFNGAFIVAYKDGQRISLQSARQEIGR